MNKNTPPIREYDTIEYCDNSLIQHGRQSNRVYLMKLSLEDVPGIIKRLNDLAVKNNYSKIFAKVPRTAADEFLSTGYVEEAAIPGFYHGQIEGCFLSKFLDSQRAHDPRKEEIDAIIALAEERARTRGNKYRGAHQYSLSFAKPSDVNEMSSVYQRVFDSYPFPIDDPEYLLKTMKTHIQYYWVKKVSSIIALASAEMDLDNKNVEMTDFATLPEYRKKGLARWLLSRMEVEMRIKNMHVAYTIARALSPGINITFAKKGYTYAGTLVHNTKIAGTIESMNVWYKELKPLHSSP